ncbi:hypothetical protein JXQ70_00940 [bacterium]|nr:hypothetical protein [bacterium]
MPEKLKSALEIAMAKYNINPESLDNMPEHLKAKIAEIRNFYASKRAELEILHQQEIKKLLDAPPSDYATLKEKTENNYQLERTRLDNEEKKRVREVREQSHNDVEQ